MHEQVQLYTNDFSDAEAEIIKLGGRITHKFSDTAFVAALPELFDTDDLKRSSTSRPAGTDEITDLLIEAWENRPATESNETAAGPEEGKRWNAPGYQAPDSDDIEDVDGAPTADTEDIQESTGTPTSLYMTGSIAVGVVVVDGPTNDLKFSASERLNVISEVQEGLNFLVNLEPRAKISFVYDVHFETVSAGPGPTTSYESAEGPWRNEALGQMGFPASRSGSIQYVQDLRTKKDTDWAYVVYFTKYPLKHFAYAGGERTVMHYDNDGWGSHAINRVFAHESCHIFGAADEYGSCGCSSVHGFLGIPNKNCVNCPGNQEPCLMNANTLQMCEWSRKQLGWDESLFPGIPSRLTGQYTIQQKSNNRFLDAHESKSRDYSVVTRTAQNNTTQRWILTQVGQVCTIQQKSNNRFFDAYQSTPNDYAAVTRPGQNNDTQRWVMIPTADAFSTYTIQQLSSGRFLDAHVTSTNDFAVVTRTAQNNDSQRWQLNETAPNTFTMRQVVNGRYMDAHESGDHRVVTRTAQGNDTQRWVVNPVAGIYTIQQASNSRNLDAHEIVDKDYNVVTRVSQNNDTQLWVLTPLGNNTYTVQQMSSARYLDAYSSSGNDYSAVTRGKQNNDTQRWIIQRP